MELKAFMPGMILDELADAVGGYDNVSIENSDRATYGVDYFWVGRMWEDRGQVPPMPDWIVRPGSAQEVSKILKIANYYKIPVHIWGGGSGSQGGALPMSGGIMMDMKRMNRLIEIDEVSRTITAEAGMIFQQLEWYANEKGYSCQHIPSCLTCGTIGGALGHRGIGIMSTKYGKIDDQCISMEVVLPNGDIINTLPVPKHAAGPDLNQIFIGSEGTLGVITKATFKLYEQPEDRQFRAFLFPDMHAGYMAGRDIMQKVKP
ncbi:MAG: FAD-binding oxidoreductase, partial [Clostridiales bacterium]|nr:FAD-binding oxidoreductase [Clostridiales bacterium]